MADLNPQVNNPLFAPVLLLLRPVQIEEVDLVFQLGGLKYPRQRVGDVIFIVLEFEVQYFSLRFGNFKGTRGLL